MSRAIRRLVAAFVWIGMAAVVVLGVVSYGRLHPQDVPWAPLDLGDPIGRATGSKLVALGEHPRHCRALLTRAGVRFVALPPRAEGAACGYHDAVRFGTGGARTIRYAPASLGVACPVAAALALWEWNVVQPEARRLLGTSVSRIETFGSYSCRRMYSRDGGAWSEHARSNAVDVAGFVFADGRRVTVARDWRGDDRDAAFLRAVRDGACRVFATTLSPDYNAAHRDHLHLDQADRAMRWRACR